MVLIPVECPDCQSIDVSRYGTQPNGEQRYRCHNMECPRTIFLLHSHDKGRLPTVKQQIVDMTLHGSGVRNIVRVCFGRQCCHCHRRTKKKEPDIQHGNENLLRTLDPEHVHIIVRTVKDAEIDEMGSFVRSKRQQRWLWHAIAHHTGQAFASVFGKRKDKVILQLQALFALFDNSPLSHRWLVSVSSSY